MKFILSLSIALGFIAGGAYTYGVNMVHRVGEYRMQRDAALRQVYGEEALGGIPYRQRDAIYRGMRYPTGEFTGP